MAPTTAAERGRATRSRWEYRVPLSGHTVVVTTPDADPELWSDYLEGAAASYREHDVEHALDLDGIRDGRSTTAFFAILSDDGVPIGGIRCQGPYDRPEQSHALGEWDADHRQPLVRAFIEERIPEGLIEMKGAWVSARTPARRALVASLARTPIHAATVTDARYTMGTAAAHTVAFWVAAGGVVADAISPVSYPDERYRTSMVCFDRVSLATTLTGGEREAVDGETAQILGSADVPAQVARS